MSEVNIHRLRNCILAKRYEVSLHAEKERREEDIRLRDVKEAILRGEIIEEHPDDPRGPSCLVFGTSAQRPIHVVCGMLPTGWIRIITVYVPRMPKWITPKQRRSG